MQNEQSERANEELKESLTLKNKTTAARIARAISESITSLVLRKFGLTYYKLLFISSTENKTELEPCRSSPNSPASNSHDYLREDIVFMVSLARLVEWQVRLAPYQIF